MAMETKTKGRRMLGWLRGIVLRFLAHPVYYINGPETLPPPLTQAEEAVIFVKLENNDESAKQELIVHNLMHLRKCQSQKNEISIDEPLNVDWDGNELLLSDVLGTDSDSINRPIEQDVERGILMDAINRLGDRERTIMQLRFGILDGRERTQKEVADVIGISQSYISRLEKRIIKRLKKDLEKLV